jgi:uncharacterized membrane protein YraQ (UPF0718 family)
MVSKDAAPRGTAGWVFLAVVVLIYGMTAFFAPELISRAFVFFVQVLARVIPVLALVFVLIFLFDLFLNPKRVEKYIGKKSGFKGWLVAIVAGILSSGPVYAWYTVLSELREKGMRTSLVAVFLYNRAVKFPLLPLMVHYFGVRYTLVLSLYLIGFSIISGLIMEKIEDKGAVADSL